MNEILENEKDGKEFKISKEAEDHLYDELTNLRSLQNEGRTGSFGIWIRSINNWNLLILERGIECFLQKEDTKIGYEIARSYVEKYNSSYGTGIILASLPFLQDVIIFWKEYYKELLSNIEKPKKITRKKPIKIEDLVANLNVEELKRFIIAYSKKDKKIKKEMTRLQKGSLESVTKFQADHIFK